MRLSQAWPRSSGEVPFRHAKLAKNMAIWVVFRSHDNRGYIFTPVYLRFFGAGFQPMGKSNSKTTQNAIKVASLACPDGAPNVRAPNPRVRAVGERGYEASAPVPDPKSSEVAWTVEPKARLGSRRRRHAAPVLCGDDNLTVVGHLQLVLRFLLAPALWGLRDLSQLMATPQAHQHAPLPASLRVTSAMHTALLRA